MDLNKHKYISNDNHKMFLTNFTHFKTVPIHKIFGWICQIITGKFH